MLSSETANQSPKLLTKSRTSFEKILQGRNSSIPKTKIKVQPESFVDFPPQHRTLKGAPTKKPMASN